MRIQMLTLYAGPEGVREIGKTYDVPAAEAKELIAGGYALVPADVEPEEPEADEATTPRPKRGRRSTI